MKLKEGQTKNRTLRLGCQTNAWPIELDRPETLFAVLDAMRTLQFDGFETGFRNIISLGSESNRFREHAEGLTFFGVHIFLQEYDAFTRVAPIELATRVAEAGAELGAKRLILSGAAAAQGDDRCRKIDGLNKIAQVASSLGLKLAYHNHRAEFESEEPEIETLISGTDPKHVWFLLDAGHIFRAKIDIFDFLQRHSSRLTGIHLRDFEGGHQVPLGSGEFPLRQVADIIQRDDWSGWVLVEEEREDGSKPGLAAVEPARQAIRSAFGQ